MSIALLDKNADTATGDYAHEGDIAASLHAKNELEENRQDTERFVRCCGHDLKQPLRTVNSMLSLLRKDNFHVLDERSSQYIDLSLKATKEMDHLVEYLSEYIALEDCKPTSSAVELTSLLERSQEALRPTIIEKAANIIVVGELPTIHGDPDLLGTVFYNILSNALKFSPKPMVEIRAAVKEVEGQTVNRIEVQDNGIGIAEEHHQQIFRPFNRLHCKQDYSGAGLGMAISKKIIKKHGGTIGVTSASNGGACFWVRLPV